ncbi:Maltose/maltodextrin import ATP-binding protein MalK [Pseudovibrio axinellae]|uniref:Maltose/maltodextrin import ATP-binding protein MalK n=1 Tax=Pseudovibrio axinellae TaxID=989403 RepID=A0A165XPE2_9HYPH|nr:ABC transporter ATP-binding protein [Pseudovibrio axinellae]KZL17914.1 Maltose/maltodextrin import ATP-binding protein MalK [Pseudovibrio axinellae]SER58007.1 carbohydrate ABC transporter ATP-binding protein, CUT1 family [Pseudovibrio axinellae]
MNSIEIKDLSLRFGEVEVLKNLNLSIHKGEFLVLLGSSGCGKSTLLNCVAGLLDLSHGQIFIDERNVTWEEPKDRGIGMVFQSYALYPQMSVRGNLSFGLKNAGIPKAEIAKRIQRAAEILQIQDLLHRKPAALSGGQRQRVAIGRALVRDVDVFLFDEPLSNLDAKLRADLRVEINRLHHRLKNTMIYVTHDQIEAMTLADRIAVMRDGNILQLDVPSQIYNRPINKYIAGFIGSPSMNFLEGKLSAGDNPSFIFGDERFDMSRYRFDGEGQQNGATTLGVRPEHIRTGNAAQEMPISRNIVVEVVEPMGSDTLVRTHLAGQEFRLRMDGLASVNKGDNLLVGFDPAQVSLFETTSEQRL